MESPNDAPRCHHYTMAHVALRSVAFDQPMVYLGVLASEHAADFLQEVYHSVLEHCGEEAGPPAFAAADLKVHTGRALQYPCAVVEMPAPLNVTEAYFAAAVLLADLSPGAPDATANDLRFFTMEKGYSIAGGDRTVFCEWTADGQHLNFGDGPPATVQDFVRAIQERLV